MKNDFSKRKKWIGGNSGRIRFRYVLILNQVKYIVVGLSVKLVAVF
jgi:hypothetical protein